MSRERLESRLGIYSIGINLAALAVTGVLVYLGKPLIGILAFLVTVTVLTAAIYSRETQS